ncbi:hypothetical protein [Streptomyces sp. NPDC051162]|uniref:hypothetical protein n=1 Tax=Streptomyces sp. NPDC051162 TaxID=3154747 RepID=UPI0034239E27
MTTTTPPPPADPTATALHRDAAALLEAYAAGTWTPTQAEREHAEDVARGRLTAQWLRAGARQAPPSRLADVLALAAAVAETVADDQAAAAMLAVRQLLDAVAPPL